MRLDKVGTCDEAICEICVNLLMSVFDGDDDAAAAPAVGAIPQQHVTYASQRLASRERDQPQHR